MISFYQLVSNLDKIPEFTMDNLFWIKDNENWNKFGLRWIISHVDSLAHFVGLVLKRLTYFL